MTEADILHELDRIFKQVFREPTLDLKPSLAASDVSTWDSITHLDMLAMVESQFGIRIPTWEIASIHNVGDLVALIVSLQNTGKAANIPWGGP